MDNLPEKTGNPADHPATIPILPRRVFAKKLVGVLIGAFVGIPVGWCIGHYGYAWATADQHLFPIAGALSGAVIGALLPGRTLGRLGWAIVLGTALGSCFFPDNPKASPPFVMGALWGFFAGLTLGIVLESVGRFTARAKR